jgi:hypothetical protein
MVFSILPQFLQGLITGKYRGLCELSTPHKYFVDFLWGISTQKGLDQINELTEKNLKMKIELAKP